METIKPLEEDGLKSARSQVASHQSAGKSKPLVKPEPKFTRTKLIEERQKEWVPDISYDLDGDGFVGGHDYVVARRFDKGAKNYLT